jgi:hypothetical protein
VTLSVADVVLQFRRALDGRQPAVRDPLLDALLELHDNNITQWRTEDVTRSTDASDAVVARAKREIDALNLRRHTCVEAVDALIAKAIIPDASAPPATESPAMAFDRLSVLLIRIHHTERAAAPGSPDAERFAARLPNLRRQLEVLTTALQALVDDARRGTRSYLPYEHLKLYGLLGREMAPGHQKVTQQSSGDGGVQDVTAAVEAEQDASADGGGVGDAE